MGDSCRHRACALVHLVTTFALSVLSFPHGLLWLAVAYVVRSYLTLPLQILFLRQASGIRFTDTWAAVRGPFLAAAGMGLAVWAAEAGWRRIGVVDWPALALLVPGGAGIYFAPILALSPGHCGRVRWGLEAIGRTNG